MAESFTAVEAIEVVAIVATVLAERPPTQDQLTELKALNDRFRNSTMTADTFLHLFYEVIGCG